MILKTSLMLISKLSDSHLIATFKYLMAFYLLNCTLSLKIRMMNLKS